MADNKYLLDMKCHNCGAEIQLDLDNLIGFCPYCGTKLLVDPIAFKEILVEKEKTKRKQIKYDRKRERDQAKDRKSRRLLKTQIVLGAICAFCIFIAYSGFPNRSSTGFLMAGLIILIFIMMLSEKKK